MDFTLINEKIKKFDLCSLFKALESQGVVLDKLLFEGSQSYSSPSNLCEEVFPSSDTITSATVKLNLGLLSSSSPLPSYYRKAMDKGELDEEKFATFLQFFNHHVIKSLITFTWVEKFFIPEWENLKSQSLYMFGLDSISSLHWLFSNIFPELNLKVKKCVKEQKVMCEDSCMGVSSLGKNFALGGYIKREMRAYSVEFSSNSAQTENRVFWPKEIRQRLEECILPLLKKTHIYLIVLFTIDQYHCRTYLNEHNHLGFTSLGEIKSDFTLSLFEGYSH